MRPLTASLNRHSFQPSAITFSPPISPFTPPRLLASPLIQTIAGNFLRTVKGVTFQRHRLQTPDGDFLHVDEALVAGTTLSANAPVVLLLHGLEGSARRGYACEIYGQLAQRGFRSLGLNFRSCSGEMNQTERMYHAGATDDVGLRLAWLAGRYPVAQALAATDLWTFDDFCTAPLHGFRSAVDYYLQNSSGRFLLQIAVPTLLLRALDDLFFSESDIPYAAIRANPNLHLVLTPHGGHVGFWEGGNRWWAETQATKFMARHLRTSYDG